MWGCRKVVAGAKFIVSNVYIKNEEISKNQSSKFPTQETREKKRINPKQAGKKIRRIRAEVKKIENKSIVSNKIVVSLKRLINLISLFPDYNKKKERTHITTIRNEGGSITTHSTDIKRIIEEYQGQPYAHKFENLHEMDQFLERYNLPGRCGLSQ